jgi:hypothetical protein
MKRKVYGGIKMNVIMKMKLMSILITFLVAITAIFLFLPFKYVLVFEDHQSGKMLAYLPIGKNDSFQMKYTHSIHLSSVIESYKITGNDQIRQYELMYEDFAIGMPANSEDGELFEAKDGRYYIRNMKRTFPSFDLRVGKVRANHTLIFKNKEFPLRNRMKPGTLVHIYLKKISVIQGLKGVDILDNK